MKSVSTIFFIFFSYTLYCQTPKYPVINIPVERNHIILTNPWSGGFNAPQFSQADLNNDGLNDLFAFDRGGDRVFTFINDGSHSDTAFHYAPQYEKLFPLMTWWAVLRDYNHDNIPDIFTNQPGELDLQGHQVPPGIKVYKGMRVGNQLHFEVVQYCLNYLFPPSVTNLWVNGIGIPGIVDVNRDGDLDILTFNVYGSAVEYYENLTTEQSLPADSLLFSLDNACWGNFYHGSASNMQVSLNISCKGDVASTPIGADLRHSAGAFSALDNDNDHDIDLLLSGLNFSSTVLLNNSGDSTYANIGWVDTLFPSCNTPARLPYFPNAYQIDGDNDGLDDLLLAPNLSSASLDMNNVLFYRHTTGDSCIYQSMNNDSFLVHTMLDFGTDSKTVFFDYNADGLMDIIIGNNFSYNPLVAGISKLALYENTGTNTQPRFREITNDYSGLSGFNLLALHPAFGDLDGDGKKDMIIGDKDGQIHFFKNTGGSTALFASMTTPVYDSIDIGDFAAPFIYDVNGDSLPDLVIGKLDGTVSYYWNFGTASNPHFHTDSANTNFGNADVSPGTFIDGNSQPFITSNSSGDLLLFVGSHRGTVFEYLIHPSNLRGGAFTLMDSDFLHYDAGMNVTMQAYDLNNDGKMEYLLGNSLGGLQLFSEAVWDSSVILSVNREPGENSFSVFPNPASEAFACLIRKDKLNDPRIEIFNLLGEHVTPSFSIEPDRVIFYSTSLANGIYMMRILTDNKMYTGRILILR